MFRRIISSILLIVGLLLILSPFIQDQIVIYLTNQYMGTIPVEEFEQNLEIETEFDFSIIEPIDINAILEAWNEDLPVVGEIMIPTVDIHLPIIRGVTNASISVGAATMKPDQVKGEGNYPLISHRMNNPDLLFTPLERLELGEKVYLRDTNQIYIYQVTEMKIIEPSQIEVLDDQEGQQLITLITCTEDGSQRLMVRGELEEIINLEETEIIEELPIVDMLNSSEEKITLDLTKIALVGIAILVIALLIKKKK